MEFRSSISNINSTITIPIPRKTKFPNTNSFQRETLAPTDRYPISKCDHKQKYLQIAIRNINTSLACDELLQIESNFLTQSLPLHVSRHNVKRG